MALRSSRRADRQTTTTLDGSRSYESETTVRRQTGTPRPKRVCGEGSHGPFAAAHVVVIVEGSLSKLVQLFADAGEPLLGRRRKASGALCFRSWAARGQFGLARGFAGL